MFDWIFPGFDFGYSTSPAFSAEESAARVFS
jgi:hypothetical protein